MKKNFLIITSIIIFTLPSCIKLDLVDFVPKTGINLEADWAATQQERGDVSLTAVITDGEGKEAARFTGYDGTARLVELEPGKYTVQLFSTGGSVYPGEDSLFQKTTAGIELPALEPYPELYLRGEGSATVEEGRLTDATVKMRQYQRELIIEIELAGDGASRINGMKAMFYSAAACISLNTGLPAYKLELPYGGRCETETGMVKEGGAYTARFRLLGIWDTDYPQSMAITVDLQGLGDPIMENADFGMLLEHFHSDKSSPLTLKGTITVPAVGLPVLEGWVAAVNQQ